MAPIAQGQSVTLDGFYDASNDNYTTSTTVGWVNGHELKNGNSVYGDASGSADSWDQTNVRYGYDEQQDYFFLYIEVPIYAKAMEWDDSGNAATTIANFWRYDLGGKNLHGEDDKTKSLDFNNATGSEKHEFLNKEITLNSKGKVNDVAFTADLDGNVDDKWGLVDSKDSVDYILESGKGTTSLSLNPDIPMAFEFKFDTTHPSFVESTILDSLERGVVFHLSPEMIPEPSSTLLLGMSSVIMLLRRKR